MRDALVRALRLARNHCMALKLSPFKARFFLARFGCCRSDEAITCISVPHRRGATHFCAGYAWRTNNCICSRRHPTIIAWRFVVIAAICAAIIFAAPIDAQAETQLPNTGGIIRAAESSEPESECALRLTKFEALDKVLDSNPSSAAPMVALLQTYFPVEKCDIDLVFKICRQSKFFFDISNHPTYYHFTFNNGGFFDTIGFYVGFALLKSSASSHLPYAQPNKNWIRRK
jgi:hypothetical protein